MQHDTSDISFSAFKNTFVMKWKGSTEIVDILLKSGASLSVVNNQEIKPSVKLRQSNIKLFKCRIMLLLKQKM
jgi:hypothetical protein